MKGFGGEDGDDVDEGGEDEGGIAVGDDKRIFAMPLNSDDTTFASAQEYMADSEYTSGGSSVARAVHNKDHMLGKKYESITAQ